MKLTEGARPGYVLARITGCTPRARPRDTLAGAGAGRLQGRPVQEIPKQPETKALAELADGVPIHSRKGNFFRVIHVDGAHGGSTPQGTHIAMSLYSERVPIPSHQKLVLRDGQQEPVDVPGENKEGIFRELEVCAIMDLAVAKSINVWLAKRIVELEKIQTVIENLNAKATGNDAK